MSATVTDPETSLHSPYAAWRDAAVADGWTERPGGPWGIQSQPATWDPRFRTFAQTGERRDGDRSVALYKGDMTVVLADREDSPARIWRSAQGWFGNGLQAWGTVPKVYDAQVIHALRGQCTACGQQGAPERLTRIGFAGKICPDCDSPQQRAALEFPGWES